MLLLNNTQYQVLHESAKNVKDLSLFSVFSCSRKTVKLLTEAWRISDKESLLEWKKFRH